MIGAFTYITSVLIFLSVVAATPDSFRNVEPESSAISNQQSEVSIPPPTPPAGTPISVSPGLFFPLSDGETISNTMPTIIGKIGQSVDHIYLDTDVVKKQSTVSGQDWYFLEFIPGSPKNIEFILNGKLLSTVYAIPQFPEITCGENPRNEETGYYYEDRVDYTTTEECLSHFPEKVPPLVFFLKPDYNLTSGKHVLEVRPAGQEMISMEFTLDRQFKGDLPAVEYKYLQEEADYNITYEDCARGYYYPRSYLHIDLPRLVSGESFFALAFPKSGDEMSEVSQKNIVFIKFDGRTYELFFPNAERFYGLEPDELNPLTNYKPFQKLFIPLEHVVYADGTNALPFDSTSITHPNVDWASPDGLTAFYQFVQLGSSTETTSTHFLGQPTTGSSWCDD